MSVNGTRPSLFYGTVKVHKEGNPLRPVVSTIGSATYAISKFVSESLRPYARQIPSFIKNTEDFIAQLQNVTIAPDEVMVSFDVKSLFTSVPAKEATTAILETITSDSTFCERTKLAPRTLIALLNLCLTATNFKFLNEYYELTNGLAIGAPASPIIATIFMGKLEDRALATFDTPPRVWYRYVDDVFSIVKRALVDKLLQHLNSQHPSIQFTVEVEKDGQLPYMDVTVSRDDQTNKLLTTVFRKPTHTGRYLHYTSHHPDSAKRSVVCSLAKRKKYITLSDQAVQAEEQQLRLDLTANGWVP